MRIRRSRFAVKSVLICIGLTFFSLALLTRQLSPKLIVRDLGYLTRPIWDRPGPQPQILIPHFHADNVSFQTLCNLHGWSQLVTPTAPKVIDAVIFSVELDILEIRIRELWDVVDIFLVMEADRTFTGKPKRLFLHENLSRFDWAQEKLRTIALVSGELDEHPKKEFDNEVKMRRKMTNAIQNLDPKPGDLIIVSDVDEIPYKETIQLLRSCVGFPKELHLQMRNYIYSFEFYVDSSNWIPHVDIYDSNFGYHHSKGAESNHTLIDAGWHCSFCFRYLSDFVFKMTSYSHHDRVTADHLLERENIQKKICDGANIFDMFPEAYSFRELFASLGNVPRTMSTFGIPSSVMQFSDKFKFLLPGGCIREDATLT